MVDTARLRLDAIEGGGGRPAQRAADAAGLAATKGGIQDLLGDRREGYRPVPRMSLE